MVRDRVLLDTGPLVAILSSRDNYHALCISALPSLSPPLLTSWAVLTEAHWLLRNDSGAVGSLFKAIRGNLVEIIDLETESLPWLEQFLLKYQDMGAQLADATLVYLAERYQINTVFTLDRRDFSIYRIKGNQSLYLIPEL